jgi:hypothetical protein
MRLLIPVLTHLVCSTPPVSLNRDILGTFVSLECWDDPERLERTLLGSTFNQFTLRLLAEWYALDEETFVANAMPTVKAVHEITLEDHNIRGYFENNIRPLREKGLNDEGILDHLTRRYYRSLRRMEELKVLEGRK